MVKCFICNKDYSSLQQFENHLLIAKKKCHIASNLVPPDFNQHLFNRAFKIEASRYANNAHDFENRFSRRDY